MLSRIPPSILLFYQSGKNLVGNYGLEMAGYLTFLALLSLFPYLLLMVSAAGFIGQGEAGSHFITLLLENLPGDAVAALRPRIEEITSGPPQHLLTFAVLGAVWTSSSAVEAVRKTLNRAYRVHQPPAYLRRRLISIAQIFMLTFVILVVILLFVFVPLLFNAISHYTGIAIPFEFEHFMTTYFNFIGVAVLFGVVAMFYHVLPNIKQSWMVVAPGALLVVALWFASVKIVSFYLTDLSNVTLIYGSLSGFVATLIFFYVMNVIFIYGAEFNHTLMEIRGQKIEERE